MFEFDEKEMLGKSADVIFTPEDRAQKQPEKERRSALKTGRAIDERWHIRKDGSRFFASGVMVPVFRGEVHKGFAKIARDLTQLLHAESNRVELEMLKRLVDGQESERQRIARDLHDTVGQSVTALRLKLESLSLDSRPPQVHKETLERIKELAGKLDEDISFLTWELRPTALENLGLQGALRNYVAEWSKTYGIKAEYHRVQGRKPRLRPETEINLYRITQESLNNVVKHSNAKKVEVILEFKKDNIVLVVEDNGRGFNPGRAERVSTSGAGLGLIGMRERAALLGGTLQIESAKGKGTTIIARVPLGLNVKPPKGRKAKKKP
jgi:PAS domain S-box-containing protein